MPPPIDFTAVLAPCIQNCRKIDCRGILKRLSTQSAMLLEAPAACWGGRLGREGGRGKGIDLAKD